MGGFFFGAHHIIHVLHSNVSELAALSSQYHRHRRSSSNYRRLYFLHSEKMEITQQEKPLAGLAEIAELRAFSFKTESAERLLKDPELQPSDKFMMYLLAGTMKSAWAFNSIMTTNSGDPSGVEYKQATQDKYAFVLPNASQIGSWRVSYFDKHGFSYHEVAPTMQKATEMMVAGGFTEPAAGSLECLAATKSWELGVAFGDLIMQLNRGAISHSRFAELQAELNAKYQDAPASVAATVVNDSAFVAIAA